MLNNKWFQLSASVVAMIMIANLQYAWTFFVPPLQNGTGWKLSDIQPASRCSSCFRPGCSRSTDGSSTGWARADS